MHWLWLVRIINNKTTICSVWCWSLAARGGLNFRAELPSSRVEIKDINFWPQLKWFLVILFHILRVQYRNTLSHTLYLLYFKSWSVGTDCQHANKSLSWSGQKPGPAVPLHTTTTTHSWSANKKRMLTPDKQSKGRLQMQHTSALTLIYLLDTQFRM